MIYDDDADLSLLDGKTVAVIGYGSQGHAHSLNLKDSGIDVVVGLRPDSASVEQARSNGLEVTDVADAASRGDVVMVLLPDEKHSVVFAKMQCSGEAGGPAGAKCAAPERASICSPRNSSCWNICCAMPGAWSRAACFWKMSGSFISIPAPISWRPI